MCGKKKKKRNRARTETRLMLPSDKQMWCKRWKSPSLTVERCKPTISGRMTQWEVEEVHVGGKVKRGRCWERLDRGRFSLPKLQMLLRSRGTQGLDAAEPMSGLKKTGDYWDWISYLLDSRWWRPSGSIGGWRLRWNTGNCRPKKGLIERKVSFPCERA